MSRAEAEEAMLEDFSLASVSSASCQLDRGFIVRSFICRPGLLLATSPTSSTICVDRIIPSWKLATLTHNDAGNSFDQPSVGELIPLQEAAKLSGLSAGHLRLLVSRGKLWGTKIGRNWVTTAQAVVPGPGSPTGSKTQKTSRLTQFSSFSSWYCMRYPI